MRHLYIHLFFILIFTALFAQDTPDKFGAPGMKGMNSVWDVDNLDPAQSRYSLNVDIESKPGKVLRRKGVVVTGTNTEEVYGAYGYANPQKKLKQIIAITQGDSTLYAGRDDSGDSVTFSPVYVSDPGAGTGVSAIRRIGLSDNGGYDMTFDTLLNVLMYLQKDYDFASIEGNVIISDGKNIPMLFVPQGLKKVEDLYSIDTLADSSGERLPWATSLGIEAPGQLRVGPLYGGDTLTWSGNYLTGTYRYAYRHRNTHGILFHYDSTTYGTHSSIPSRWVILDGERPYLTLFEGMPDPVNLVEPEDSDTLSMVYIERQKYGQPWYKIDSFYFRYNETPFYVDSIADGSGEIVGPGSYEKITRFPTLQGGKHPEGDYSPRSFQYIKDYKDLINPLWLTVSGYGTSWCYWAPGALFQYADSGVIWDTVHVNDSINMPRPDSFYYVGYSYYDPVSDLESPIGPLVAHQLVDSVAGPLWYRRGFVKSYSNPRQRPQYIRVYRSENKGAGSALRDNDYLYCVAEVRANYCYPHDSTIFRQVVFPGFGHDSQMTTGYDFVFTEDTAAGYNYLYTSNNIVLDEFGDAFVRPPFVKQLEIPLSDVEYFKNKLFGVGDPLYPNRLYYSDAESFYQWSAAEYISIAENTGDALVALATAGVEEEYLYAFKHNEIWMIAGYDVEYDLSFHRIEDNVGLLNKRAMVKANNTTYFMSPDLKIYALSGRNAEEISLPIENWIDSLFVNYTTADSSCYTYQTEAKVYFGSYIERKALAFNYKSNTWSLEDYGTGWTPTGYIVYDTTLDSGQVAKPFFGYTKNSYLLYQRDTVGVFVSTNNSTDGIDFASTNFLTKYQTPFVGDGDAIWRINDVQFTLIADSGSYVTMEIYDERESLLVTDSIQVRGSSKSAQYKNGFAFNSGLYLSVRFSTDSTTNTFELSDIKINKTRVGYQSVGY